MNTSTAPNVASSNEAPITCSGAVDFCAQKSTAPEQVIGASFDEATFGAVDVFIQCVEGSWLSARMHRQQFHVEVVDADQPGVPPGPNRSADILRRRGVIGL